jgi:hypothetical protein
VQAANSDGSMCFADGSMFSVWATPLLSFSIVYMVKADGKFSRTKMALLQTHVDYGVL